MSVSKLNRRLKIKKGIRKKISGTAERPRLTVYRSNKEIYAQVVNDVNGVTIASAASLGSKEAHSANKVDQAALIGKMVAEKAISNGVNNVIFDRNGYLYHGRIKALADAAREAGLNF